MISVILLHHDKAAYSRACLQSLLRGTARPLEIVNIDNGCRDGTPQVLDEWEPMARATGIATRRHTFATNAGAVTGRNVALQLAGGDDIVFLDNDTIVSHPGWLEALRTLLHADARRAIVAPQLLFPWQPYLIECCGCGVAPSGRIQYRGRGRERGAIAEAGPVQCAISAAWMMPRRLVEEIGPLDEAYSPVQYEDIDFCYRARAAGYQVWATPEVEVYHFEHTTTAGSGDINFKYVTTRNGITFKKRWQATYASEAGPDEAAAQWQVLPKLPIERVDWQALINNG